VDEPDPGTIRAAAEGDSVAFERLVHGYQAHVFRFLRHLLGDAALAEDVTQDTFLRVHQGLHGFRWRSKFSTWVFQIARNAGIDALRTRARQARVISALEQRPAVARATADPAAWAELEAGVRSLSTKHREALLLVEVLGLTYAEAASVTGVPEGTVKSRVFQARERLASWLSEEHAGEV
jgi:RNA polymerase sigma-70 factor (ECF subfamily)